MGIILKQQSRLSIFHLANIFHLTSFLIYNEQNSLIGLQHAIDIETRCVNHAICNIYCILYSLVMCWPSGRFQGCRL